MGYYTFQELRRAIEQCNYRKGYGSVAEVKRFADGALEVVITRPHMRDTIRKGHVIADRVKFAGTSAKIYILTSPDYN